MRHRPSRCWPPSAVRCSRLAAAVSVCAALCLGGCPFVAPPDVTGLDDAGNDTFKTATKIDLGPDDEIEFDASIDTPADADIFDLGELAPGDRLYVDVQTTGGDLDPLAAVFDERQYLLAFNDDRLPDASDLNPLIDVIAHGPRGSYFLGVAAYPGSSSSGSYRVLVRVTRGVGLLDPEPQIVYLDWRGGQNIRLENVGTFDIDPFDAADLGFPGRTAELKDLIQAEIADRYDGYNLILLNSDDDPVPRERHSTVYFGGRAPSVFAIAEQVDTFNADPGDNAIVFTDGFQDAFMQTPTLAQLATAIGNTAAHEIGHLLGLVHTADCRDLMDTTCPNDVLLVDQAFRLAPLDDSVFPIGLQNAAELIEWTIGLAGI